MTGEIIALFNKGRFGSFGFIRDEANQDRWFDAKALDGLSFGDLEKGAKVNFEPTTGGRNGNGLRAEHVRLTV